MRIRLFLLLACATGATAPLHAAEPQPANEEAASCLEVEVNGERTPSYSCLTQKLQPSAKPAPTTQGAPELASEAIARRPTNQLGLVNQAATSHRMGNTFGTSVFPQRPPGHMPASPVPIPAPRK